MLCYSNGTDNYGRSWSSKVIDLGDNRKRIPFSTFKARKWFFPTKAPLLFDAPTRGAIRDGENCLILTWTFVRLSVYHTVKLVNGHEFCCRTSYDNYFQTKTFSIMSVRKLLVVFYWYRGGECVTWYYLLEFASIQVERGHVQPSSQSTYQIRSFIWYSRVNISV